MTELAHAALGLYFAVSLALLLDVMHLASERGTLRSTWREYSLPEFFLQLVFVAVLVVPVWVITVGEIDYDFWVNEEDDIP